MVAFPGAVLVLNGDVTTCEFALIDNQAAFISASCLPIKNGSVDTDSTYAIYFSPTTDYGASSVSINPSDIHIHPQYDPATFANNIAIAEYDFSARGSWVNYIAVYESEWTDSYYVRRRLVDTNGENWASTYDKSYSLVTAACQTQSPLYAQNAATMLCNQIQTANSWNGNCPMPYGSVYGVVSEGMAIGGLYSHAFMFDTDFCSGARGLYYFLLLGNYVAWGESVIGRNINKLVDDTTAYGMSAQTSSYSMTDVANPNPQGMYVYSGNLISPTAWALSSSGTSNTSTTPAGSTQQSTSVSPSMSAVMTSAIPNDNTVQGNGASDTVNLTDAVPNDNTDQGNDTSDTLDYLNPANNASLFPQPTDIFYSDSTESATSSSSDGDPASVGANDKTRKGAKIAVAISVPVAVILLAVCGFLLFKKWKGRISVPNRLPFTRKKQTAIRQELVEQIGGVSEEEQLPTYDEILQTIRFSVQTTSSERSYT
ncbi:hypothetical protein LPJ59_003219 [Coemansia sp. RSA 2399]|nr:hypothetical protein LPJ59_003219 [Coemansia sp. RSA 2399]